MYIISASLHRAKRLYDRTFACAICRSAHVSSGNTTDCIRMPFGVVSGVGIGMGVWYFGGDRRRGRGSLGEYNAEMAYWSIIDSCVKSWQYFPTPNVS